MKIVFKYLFLGALALGWLANASVAEADSNFYTKRTMLSDFFPTSDKVSFVKFAPSHKERAALERRLGYKLSKSAYYFYVATSKLASSGESRSVVDGYAFIDDQLGQHKPITFAVKLSPEGVVLREEVMVYRESHGGEVRSPRFSKQFRGKTVKDSLRPNKDIDCVSGATISSRAITVGVRRALVLFDAAITTPRTMRVSQTH